MSVEARLKKLEAKASAQRQEMEAMNARVRALFHEAQAIRQKDAATLTASEQDVLRRAERLMELMTLAAQRKAAGWKPGQQEDADTHTTADQYIPQRGAGITEPMNLAAQHREQAKG